MNANVRSLRERYVTLAGEELEFPTPTGKLGLFLAKVRQAADSPSVDEEGITALVWSLQNPLLSPSPVSGAPMATKETYENPMFRVMLDCISRKRVTGGSLDLTAAAQKYTMTVPEAAISLGIHETSVRKAIATGRLSAWRKGGAHYLDPASIAAYQVSDRGMRARPRLTEGARMEANSTEKANTPTEFLSGTSGVRTFQVKYKGPAVQRKQLDNGEVWGQLPEDWKQIAVLTGNKESGNYWLHIFVHTEDEAPQSFTYGKFYLRGHIGQEAQQKSRRAVLEQWEAFKAE